LLQTAQRKFLKQGILIAIEGIDGAGKTTQSKLLCDKLTESGYAAVCLHEPTDGKWGKKIRDLALNGRHTVSPEKESDFFYFDRVEDVEKNIRPALREKKVIVMDRYYLSNVAYQGAMGLKPDSIERRNEKVAPKPDLTIILDIDPGVGLQRIRKSRDKTPNYFEREKYLGEVKEVFIKQFSNRPNFIIMNGDNTNSIERVASDIWEAVLPMLKKFEAK
jgi:dTMP kinase